MGDSMRERLSTSLDKLDVIARPQPAKVTTLDKTAAAPLSEVVLEAVKLAYRKQGAAAMHLGKNEGNFSRDVKAGRITIGHLEALGPEFLAEFGKELVEQFAPLADPKDRARRLCDDVQAIVNELRQFIEAA